MSALSNTQKRILSQLAERAFNRAAALARGRGDVFDSSKAAMDEWRHEQVGIAVQKAGLRCCDQADYKRVEAHFLNLLEPKFAGKAFNAEVRSHSEKQRQLLYLIEQACGKFGYDIGFARALAVRIHKVSLEDAGADLLRLILITVNARGAEKRKREAMPAKEVAA